ncbi:MAG TPA: hypothetical protein ENK36_04725 [Desulfobacterales bacterium]|nr:hypothetical protein [Desulfobacterales bacterium]
MKKHIFLNIFIFTVLALYASVTIPLPAHSKTKGVKTSYKRYSLFKYKNEDVLCEPYIVNKDDWLYKIFRKKGEISEKDFPHFIIIFKKINPQISNIDAIKPGNHILIPLKKVHQKDYNQSTSGNIDIPVIEFSTVPEDLNMTPFTQKHKMEKGDTILNLIDKDFLKKKGVISEEGLKAFGLANPDIKNINIIHEGADIYLPDPSIKSQPWFKSILSGKPIKNESYEKKQGLEPYKIDAYKLAQLKKYSSLIGGTLLNHGKMYFPGKNNSTQVLDLSSTPIIETSDGSKILMISGDNVNDELLEYVKTYWASLKTQLISDAIDQIKTGRKMIPPKNVTTEYKKIIDALLSQTEYDYIPDAKIPFMLNTINLEASFGRVIRQDTTDLLINFGNVYGAALEGLEKKDLEIMSITPKLTVLELTQTLFTHLGYTTWVNPSFSTEGTIKRIDGLYAVKEQDKLFIPAKPLNTDIIDYLKKEGIKILATEKLTPTQ